MVELSAKNAGIIKLGDVQVNRLGLGTNRISNNDESRTVLKLAVELGVNFIDTADKYGQSEEVIGQTLAPYPPGVVVATKGGWKESNSPEHLQECIDKSLRLLKVERIELWQLHRVDQSVPIEETMAFLKTQMQAGKIKNIGLSEVRVEQIEKARAVVPIASVQNKYNLLERQHEDVLDYCAKEGIAFLPFFPLASGGVAQNSKLNEIAKKYGASGAQIAIAWLLKRSPMMLPIPGTLSIEHLESNIAAANINLTDEDYELLSNN
ncbi:aldo/keto reductase [Candidatus Saccharibacteria bacterium]|nr:aldo/keto reductase [Candidatus Saccharibacteria bacterium]